MNDKIKLINPEKNSSHLVDEREALQLLEAHRHRSWTTPRGARSRARTFHPGGSLVPAASNLLAVDDQLGLTDQHLPLNLKTQVGGGIEQPALDGMPDLKVKVAIRSNKSGVKIDDAFLSALADDHFAFSKQPKSEPSRADDDHILLGLPLLHL